MSKRKLYKFLNVVSRSMYVVDVGLYKYIRSNFILNKTQLTLWLRRGQLNMYVQYIHMYIYSHSYFPALTADNLQGGGGKGYGGFNVQRRLVPNFFLLFFSSQFMAVCM